MLRRCRRDVCRDTGVHGGCEGGSGRGWRAWLLVRDRVEEVARSDLAV